MIKKSNAISIDKNSDFIDICRVSIADNKSRAERLIDAFIYASVCKKNNRNEIGFTVLSETIQSILNSRLNEKEDSYFEINDKDGKIALYQDENGKMVYSSFISLERNGLCVVSVSKGNEFRNGLKGIDGLKKVSSILSEILNSVNFDYAVLRDAINPTLIVKTCELSQELRNYFNSYASNVQYRAYELNYINQHASLNDAEKETLLSEMSSIIITSFKRENKEGKLGGKQNDIKNRLIFLLREKYEMQINASLNGKK